MLVFPGPRQVDGLVGSVEVAADDDFAALRLDLSQVVKEGRIKVELVTQAL